MTAIAARREQMEVRWRAMADGLAIVTVASLPWSTSATSVLIVLWLIALIPTLRREELRETLAHPAAYLAIALVALGALGMLWADVTWAERGRGLNGFVKLLAIPLLFVQFRRAGVRPDKRPFDKGWHVLVGFIASCTALLLVSTLSGLFPGSALFSWVKQPGVPVKDYIIQAALFVVAAFILLHVALTQMRAGRSLAAFGYAAWGCAFLVNIVFIVTSRTALVTVPALLLVFAIRCFNWKGVCGVLALGVLAAAALWASSDNMRTRLGNLNSEIEQYRVSNELTSAGQRMEFWKKSVGFIADAPVLGHGTGTIKSLFARSASAGAGASSVVSTNPHNQFLTVAVQVGLVGGLLLIAMWIAHLLLFLKGGLAAWIGLVAVTQNIVGSLFNSHLADFSNGWLYVFGVGIAGGVVMARRESATRS